MTWPRPTAATGVRNRRRRPPPRLGGRGDAGRSAHVYGQAWLRVLRVLRGVLPALAVRGAAATSAARAERLLADAGPEATRPVGAGGAADTARLLPG